MTELQDNSPDYERINAEIADLRNNNEALQESLDQAMLSLKVEDLNMKRLYGYQTNDSYLTLDQVKEASQKSREYIEFVDIIKHAVELRSSYVWSKGVVIPGVEDIYTKQTRGAPKGVQKFFTNPVNQSSLFSAEAHNRFERDASGDGLVLRLGNNKTKEVRAIPLSEITDITVNPDFVDDIWAYRRTWESFNTTTGKNETKHRWYFTNRYTGPVTSFLGGPTDPQPVEKGWIIFDKRFNRLTGHPLGLPDAAPALASYQEYSRFLKYGQSVSESLAKFTYKVTNKTPAGTRNSAVRVAQAGGHGLTTHLTEGQDIAPLNSAGRGYDFDKGRALIARVAANFGISIVHLLSDPGAAGSSYGSASNLDLPTKRAMVSRQNEWADYLSEILEWALGKPTRVTFPALDDTDPYREAQTRALDWASGVVHADEQRARLLKESQMVALHSAAPDGVLLPNNEFSLARKDIDTEGRPGSAPASGSAATTVAAAAPDQGRSNGAGTGDSHDLRTDILANSLMNTTIDRLEEVLARLGNKL